MNIKKIISAVTSSVVTAALIGGGMAEIKPLNNLISEVIVISAEEAKNTKLEADILYVILDEIDENGRYCHWYRTTDTHFRADGMHVKWNGKDVTDQSVIEFDDGITPKSVYDGKNFDYELPVNINYGLAIAPTTVYAKIGQKNDANLDHSVDIRDAAMMARSVSAKENSSGKEYMSDFAKFLATGTRTKNQSLTMDYPKELANDIAMRALDRPKGNKVEQKGDGEYSLALSQANGLPGETVNIQVVIDANDSFESLDAVIEWNDDTLESAAAVAVNGTLSASYTGKGMVSLVDYGTGQIKDGAIASIDFKIPENAVPGSQYEVYFSNVGIMNIISGGESQSVVDKANISGTKISVNKPKTTTTSNSDNQTTTTHTEVTGASDQSTTPSTSSQITTSTTASTTTSKVLIGDADLNGVVDIRDAAFIAKKVAQRRKNEIPECADFNGDRYCDIRDAAAIAMAIAKRKI